LGLGDERADPGSRGSAKPPPLIIDGPVGAKNRADVQFEHYDMPGLKIEGDVHVAGKLKVAWFKDPDGNILNIVNG
jgi:hypothetical protein